MEGQDQPVQNTADKSSQRAQNLVYTKVLNQNLEGTSQSIKLYRSELTNNLTPPKHDRLGQIYIELNSMLSDLNSAYEQVRETTPSLDKAIVRDVDAATEEIRALQDFVFNKQKLNSQNVDETHSVMSLPDVNKAVVPNQGDTMTNKETTNAMSIRTHKTHSSRSNRSLTSSTSYGSRKSSTSSALRYEATIAKANTEAKRTQLRSLQEEGQKEDELAELNQEMQVMIAEKSRQIQRKKKELEHTKLQAEIAADERRQQVLEQAAAEEELPPVLRPPSNIGMHTTNMAGPDLPVAPTGTQPTGNNTSQAQKLEQTSHVQNALESEHRQAAYQAPDKPGTKAALNSDQISNHTDYHLPSSTPALAQIHHSNVSRHLMENTHNSSTSHISDEARLANAMLEAINLSKLPPPQPFIFNGDLLQYTDWRTSFLELVDRRPGRAAEKLALLKSYVTCDIQQQISGYCTLGTKDAYQEALAMLDEQYGDPFLIGEAFVQKLENWPTVPNNDGPALRKYVAFLKQCVASMKKVHTLQDLNTIKEMKKIISKLPSHLTRQWIRESTKHQEEYKRLPQLQHLCDYLRLEVKVACNPLNQEKSSGRARTGDQMPGEDKKLTRTRGAHSYNSTVASLQETGLIQPGQVIQSDTKPQQTPIPPNQGIQSYTKPMICRYCNKDSHETKDCYSLLNLAVEEIERFLTSNNLCYRCARGRHNSKQCRSNVECNLQECKQAHATINHQRYANNSESNQRQSLRRHPVNKTTPTLQPFTDKTAHQSEQPNSKMLTQRATTYQQQQTIFQQNQFNGTAQNHESKATSNASKGATNDQQETAEATHGQCYSIRSLESNLSLMVMPVYVFYNGEEKLTYALVDSMSDSSYISEKLFRSLNVPQSATKIKQLTLTTMNYTSTNDRLAINGLKLRGYGQDYVVKLPTMITTPEQMEINKKYIPTAQRISKWPHLEEVAKKLPPELNLDVDILLGGNCNAVHLPLEVVSASPEHPHARRTVLGWTVMGSHAQKVAGQGYSYKVLTKNINNDVATGKKTVLFECKSQLGLESQLPTPESILQILESDFTATKEERGLSIDDRRFVIKLQNEINQDESGYVTMPLPFRTKPTGMGWKTKRMAAYRLGMLQNKFNKNSDYAKQYAEFMDAIISNGDAEIVEDTPTDDSWYLPHFAVFHPKKPGKIRVVFDCSAKCENRSLNDYLLQGPDLMNNMLGVLIRFRTGTIAVTCDIERMFHQFRVANKDRNYLRFLWLDGDNKVQTYRMKVHIFGAKSSPGCATFGLRHLAKTSTDDSPSVEFITNNFYVDDGLISTDKLADAVQLIQDSIRICQNGNIRLHKFVSNNKKLLETLPETELIQSSNSQLLKQNDYTHRTLGLQWNTRSDLFQYKLDLKVKELTRRSLLSTLSSVFDPLGLIGPVIIKGKLLLQQCCRMELGWDDQLPKELHAQWISWSQSLQNIDTLEFQRCYKTPNFGTITRAELHSFSDASTQGYGACVYLRLINEKGLANTSLVLAKVRVAPNNTTTIPRLELQAAVLSTTLSNFVRKQLHNLHIADTYYYTDSQIVLGYINNEAKRFHVYVCNRVEKIRTVTKPTEWYYVPSALNPADHASRGLSAEQLKPSIWIQGPSFLNEEPLRLPKQPQHMTLANLDSLAREVKKTAITYASVTTCHFVDKLNYFSKWNKMVNFIVLLQNRIRQKLKTANLDTITCRQGAEMTIIRLLQQKSFAEEISLLKDGNQLSKSNQLYKLNPMLDSDGTLRVGGRLGHSEYLEYKEKHPIILPRTSHITDLLICYYHHKSAHQGRRATLGQLRLHGFWIIGAHSAVSSVIYKCVICKKLRGKTETPQMAPLPPERLEITPPFTYVGCDIFGPYLIKERRTWIKRYGAIFVCMASKAIHIEIVDDMTTDAFLNALRCLIAIRGPVRQLHTDRGSNFIGAANELHKQFKISKEIFKFNAEENIEFVTNVPYASHMGGIWERQIRSIRTVLNGLLKTHSCRLDLSTLRTLMYEVMAIINCRPLSHTDEEDAPLHANMLLTMKTHVVLPPPGQFDEEDVYSRKRWRQVQGLAEVFWQRWREEYLQNLQLRQKWVNKESPLQINDLVLLKDEATHRNDWEMGRITKLLPSKDKQIRKVELTLATKKLDKYGKPLEPRSVLERPVHKLVRLCRPKPQETCK